MRYAVLMLLASASLARAETCPAERAIFSDGSREAQGIAFGEKPSKNSTLLVLEATIEGKHVYILTTMFPQLSTKTEVSDAAPDGVSLDKAYSFDTNLKIYGDFQLKGCR